MVLTDEGDDFLIEPIIGHKQTGKTANPHLLYRATSVRKVRSVGTKKQELTCGTSSKKELLRPFHVYRFVQGSSYYKGVLNLCTFLSFS